MKQDQEKLILSITQKLNNSLQFALQIAVLFSSELDVMHSIVFPLLYPFFPSCFICGSTTALYGCVGDLCLFLPLGSSEEVWFVIPEYDSPTVSVGTGVVKKGVGRGEQDQDPFQTASKQSHK